MFELADHPSKLAEYRTIMRGPDRLGYCRYGNVIASPITLTKHVSESERAQIREFVERECGPVSSISMPPSNSKLRKALTNVRHRARKKRRK